MSSSGFSLEVSLDTPSLRSLQALSNYQPILEGALLEAMAKGIGHLEQAAIDVMYASFMSPSGAAEGSWESSVDSPYLAWVGNTAPYAQRLEYGFSGMTDALGRYYPYWPDYHWAENTVVVEQRPIELIFQREIEKANLAVAGGVP